MTDNEILLMVKNDLEIIGTNETKDGFLLQLIARAKALIEREGATLDLTSVEDCGLVAMYAAWLYRKRADDSPAMPRMLRIPLNNRIFGEAVNRP